MKAHFLSLHVRRQEVELQVSDEYQIKIAFYPVGTVSQYGHLCKSPEEDPSEPSE